MATIFITGGAGLIGSHLADQLAFAGHEVIVYDSFQQYTPHVHGSFAESMQYRFDVLLKDTTIMRGSTLDKDFLRRQLIDIQPDYIIHLAALPLANLAVHQTEEAFDNIVGGLVNVLEISRDLEKLQKLVYVSSSMIYGDFTQTPMPEDGTKKPKDIYGGMKLAGEILVQSFANCYDIPYIMVRPSAVYGPTDINKRVIQQFIYNALQGRKLIAHNPSATYLDFTYVEDIASGLRLATLSENSLGETFNITYGESHNLKEVIDILHESFPYLEVQIEEQFLNYQPKRGALDITKARNLLNFTPQYPLRVGMEKYIDFVREYNPSLQAASDIVLLERTA